MNRRQVVAGLSALGGSPPLRAGAQPAASPVIGFMSSRSPAESKNPLAAFLVGLREAGYVEGQNVAIEYRWAEGRYDRLPAMATDLATRGVAVLVAAGGGPSALAARAATSAIPIAFAIGGDPVKIGLVASYSRPGGNATGVSLLTTSPEAKRLGLLHELSGTKAAVGVLINPNYQEADAQARQLVSESQKIGQAIFIAYAKDVVELDRAFSRLVGERTSALLVAADPFFDTQRDRIIAFAAQQRLPAIYPFREYAVGGGLMSYGVSLQEGYRQLGIYAGQILKGVKPADLPVVQSVKFEFVVNLRTAKALGLDIPPILFARTDEVIE